MATKAYLSEKIAQSGSSVRATFIYYDDTEPQNSGVSPTVPPTVQMHAESFSFPPAWSNADMIAQVQSRGTEIRAAKVRADALALAFAVGATVTVT